MFSVFDPGQIRDEFRRSALCRIRVLIAVSSVACSSTVVGGPAPCGRNQHAAARVTLPDTGIDAGREIDVSFVQHDPDLAGELSEIAIQQAWPAAVSPDAEPDPRVRLLNGSGQILLDTLGTRFDQPTGQFDRPTWLVLHWIRDAESRNTLYDAFASQSLWLELWTAGATKPGTRVLMKTTDFGVSPPAMCL
jgi:hypothetical protein